MSSADLRVLLIEHDPRAADLLRGFFELHGVLATVDREGAHSSDPALRASFDAVLINWLLQGLPAPEVCRRIRARGDIPLLVVSPRSDESDRLLAFELGADDVIVEPYSRLELLARVRVHVRRATRLAQRGDELVVGPICLDRGARRCDVEGRSITLTTSEFDLLWALAERSGRVVGRETLVELVKGIDGSTFDRAIDVCVSRLRAKIEEAPRRPRWLRTVRGVGYVLAPR